VKRRGDKLIEYEGSVSSLRGKKKERRVHAEKAEIKKGTLRTR